MAAAGPQVPNVRSWSKKVAAYELELGDLDVYVLKEHPEIVAAMGRRFGGGAGGWSGLAVVALAIVAPVASGFAWGGTVGIGRRSGGLNPDTAATLAAACFALAIVGLGLTGWRWWRRQRHWKVLDVAAVVVPALWGVLTQVQLANEPLLDVVGPGYAPVVVWVAVGAALLLGATMALRSRGRGVDLGTHVSVTGPGDREQVRRLVRELEPRRHEKLMDERRRAVARLRERGLIDDREVAAVRALGLGYSPTLEDRAHPGQ